MRLINGKRFEPGPFNLGRYGPVIGSVAVMWVIFITVRGAPRMQRSQIPMSILLTPTITNHSMLCESHLSQAPHSREPLLRSAVGQMGNPCQLIVVPTASLLPQAA